MRRRSASSNIYQVDLIAALFAGYTIIWLTTSDRAEITETPADLDLATVNISLEGQVFEAGEQWSYRQRAGPQDLASTGCLPGEFEEYFDMNTVSISFCDAVGMPRQTETTNFNDSLAVLETLEEPCTHNGENGTYRLGHTVNFSEVMGASLFPVNVPTEFSLIGLTYSTIDPWPSPELHHKAERIPRYKDEKRLMRIGEGWNPDIGEPQFLCSYERNRTRDFEAVYIVTDQNNVKDTVELQLDARHTVDMYHVMTTGDGRTEALYSDSVEQKYTEGLLVQGDWFLTMSRAIVRLCIHSIGTAECWSGEQDLDFDTKVTLNRE